MPLIGRVAHVPFHSFGISLLPKRKKGLGTPGVEGEGVEWIILAQDRN